MKDLQAKVYADSVERGLWGDGVERPIYEVRNLINAEISEAVEAHKHNLGKDKILTEYDNFHVELADVCILCFNFIGDKGLYFGDCSYRTFESREEMLDSSHRCASYITSKTPILAEIIIGNIVSLCRKENVDIKQIIHAKHAYNGIREDHKGQRKND